MTTPMVLARASVNEKVAAPVAGSGASLRPESRPPRGGAAAAPGKSGVSRLGSPGPMTGSPSSASTVASRSGWLAAVAMSAAPPWLESTAR
jgi:hypothetical protein